MRRVCLAAFALCVVACGTDPIAGRLAFNPVTLDASADSDAFGGGGATDEQARTPIPKPTATTPRLTATPPETTTSGEISIPLSHTLMTTLKTFGETVPRSARRRRLLRRQPPQPLRLSNQLVPPHHRGQLSVETPNPR